MDFQAELQSYQDLINNALENCLNESCEQGELLEAMRYSLLAGGKRIRPILLLKFCEMCGGDVYDALSPACGIEMLHTYSLIHDDLPCMDNDDLRRGKPTCHKVYGETTAVLAGDALQAEAFSYVLTSSAPEAVCCRMAATLAEAAGTKGMCGGQYLDTCKENYSVDEESLILIHSLKTGALLRAACVMGVQCASGTEEQIRAAEKYAYHLGIAFQIRDDILDCIASVEEIGKDVGSDDRAGKFTFPSLHGIEMCESIVLQHTEKAKEALRGAFDDPSFLIELAEHLAVRRS